MLRKSPYVEENYNYITSMMDSMDLQENPQSFPVSGHNETVSNQSPSLFWNNNQTSIFNNPMSNVRNIDDKKLVEVTTSVYGINNLSFSQLYPLSNIRLLVPKNLCR